MKIEIKGLKLLNPTFAKETEKKFQQLSRFVKREEQNGESTLFIEVAKTTKHHRKGEIFYAEATLRLAKNVLRAEATASDLRSAIDQLHRVCKGEMLRHKEKKDTKQKRSRHDQ